MSRTINKVGRNTITFGKGGFDDWCVFLLEGWRARAPLDSEYFSFFKLLAERYGKEKIFLDFLDIYRLVSTDFKPEVITLIKEQAKVYADDATNYEIWMSVIYGGMIAEENKSDKILGKRIKRLGMYQLLIEDFTPEEAANFSKGRPWKELDEIMKKTEKGVN